MRQKPMPIGPLSSPDNEIHPPGLSAPQTPESQTPVDGPQTVRRGEQPQRGVDRRPSG
ncbi:hypothetical protein BJX99DRAFT_219491 [Aspergillus californicus]